MIYQDSNGNYPRYYGDIQADFPEWNLGDALPEGWLEVQETTIPEIGVDETYELGTPELVNDVLTQTWIVRPMTVEEIERRDAPKTAKAKLIALGLSEVEIQALLRGLIR